MYIFIIMISMLNKPITLQSQVHVRQNKISYLASLNNKGILTDEPADTFLIYFTGIGNLSDWAVSNIIQGGFFSRPEYDSIGKFDASLEQLGRISQWTYDTVGGKHNGKTGEYPAGSKQYYTCSAGLWIGAFKRFPGDTVWHRVVSKGAYNSDMGAMSIPELDSAGEVGDISGKGFAFSTQRIPPGYSHTSEFLFVQSGETPKSYQTLWKFADTSLNKNRPYGKQLDPTKGDVVSDEDTYAVGGDWIPEADATVMQVADLEPYDGQALGIRVEQRTYSWRNDDFLFLNYKIKNMTDDTLRNLYVGYFMDNDIGYGSDNPLAGSKDDLVGYDTSYVSELGRRMDLGYTYDMNAQEPGWTTSAGYIGCVMCETPGNKGMIGFQYWQIVGEPGNTIDHPLRDSAKYLVLSCTFPGRPAYMSATLPEDMRQLSCSGPTPVLLPGQEVDFTVAVVAGFTLDSLLENAKKAITRFNNGFYVGVEEENGKVTFSNYELKQNYPNPVVKTTEFQYTIPKASKVRLEIYNIAGEKVATLINSYETAGCKTKKWNLGNIKSGIYFYKLITPDYTVTKKLILMK